MPCVLYSLHVVHFIAKVSCVFPLKRGFFAIDQMALDETRGVSCGLLRRFAGEYYFCDFFAADTYYYYGPFNEFRATQSPQSGSHNTRYPDTHGLDQVPLNIRTWLHSRREQLADVLVCRTLQKLI